MHHTVQQMQLGGCGGLRCTGDVAASCCRYSCCARPVRALAASQRCAPAARLLPVRACRAHTRPRASKATDGSQLHAVGNNFCGSVRQCAVSTSCLAAPAARGVMGSVHAETRGSIAAFGYHKCVDQLGCRFWKLATRVLISQTWAHAAHRSWGRATPAGGDTLPTAHQTARRRCCAGAKALVIRQCANIVL